MRDMKGLRAEAVFQRYWRGFRLFRTLRWVGCLACIAWLVPHILYGGSMVTAALVFLLYLGYLFVLRLVNSLRFLSLNLILNRDCDAVKFTEVSRLLKERLGSRTSGMAGLNMAWGLYWSGRFTEAEKAMTNVELKGKMPGSGWPMWWSTAAHCIWLGRPAACCRKLNRCKKTGP